MKCIFASVMNEALICIGSNENREANLISCQQLLSKAFDNIAFSCTSITAPYGTSYKKDFINQLAIVYTDNSEDDVLQILKSLEKEIGRDPIDKKEGIVKIDIDLVIWNNITLKPEDTKRSYITSLLPDLLSKTESKLISSIL